jgi:hypothetical protein
MRGEAQSVKGKNEHVGYSEPRRRTSIDLRATRVVLGSPPLSPGASDVCYYLFNTSLRLDLIKNPHP